VGIYNALKSSLPVVLKGCPRPLLAKKQLQFERRGEKKRW